MSNWNKRYAAEKTAFDPGPIVGPIMHGLGQIGHGLGDAARNVWHQMKNPITDRFTGDPKVLHNFMDQAQNAAQHGNGQANENALNAWENYGNSHNTVDFHPLGLGIDTGLGAGAVSTGINIKNRINRKRDESARLQKRQYAWSKLPPYTMDRIEKDHGAQANPNHPKHDVNKHYNVWNAPGTQF